MREVTRKKLDKVKELMAGGLTVREACEKSGFSKAYFDRLNREKTKSKPKRRAQLITLPIPQAQFPLVVLMGNAIDVNHALDRVSKIGSPT